jgi:hypothetical protein
VTALVPARVRRRLAARFVLRVTRLCPDPDPARNRTYWVPAGELPAVAIVLGVEYARSHAGAQVEVIDSLAVADTIMGTYRSEVG